MRATIESTSKIVTLKVGNESIPARIWEGKTESGVPFHCYITRVAIDKNTSEENAEQFERELKEQRTPSVDIQAIPLHLIL